MRAAEQGFLLLTSHLGDPDSKPLSVAQLRSLIDRMQTGNKLREDRELALEDLLALGYDREASRHIAGLLSREEQLEYYVNRAKKQNCVCITRISDFYPDIFRKKFGVDCPGCLWAKGDVTLLKMPAVSLVGSRQMQPHNREFAYEAGRQAALQGYVLVSGNARGADQTAQNACLEHGGKVIAIVADSLVDTVDNPNVLYVSEDGFDEKFSAIRALSRNRLIHALGAMTFVAGCRYDKGGTWSGAVHNLRHRLSPLYCLQDGSEGIEALCGMGANAIDISALQDFSKLQNKEPSLFD